MQVVGLQTSIVLETLGHVRSDIGGNKPRLEMTDARTKAGWKWAQIVPE